MTVTSAHPALSQRERNKQDKLRRIREAALELFLSKGFDDATTREIAVRAGVGLGTIFVYAKTKRDLLFLIVNDELEETVEAAQASVRDNRSMLQNLLHIIRLHYEFYAREPVLSRLVLREMSFYDSGAQAQRFLRTRERYIQLVNDVVARDMERGLIRSQETASFVGSIIFALYQVDIRDFLTRDKRDIDPAIRLFSRKLKVLLEGLHPEAAPVERKDTKPSAKPSRKRSA